MKRVFKSDDVLRCIRAATSSFGSWILLQLAPELGILLDSPSRVPGLILMHRFDEDVSHVQLIIGESGLRPDPRASQEGHFCREGCLVLVKAPN